VIDDWTIRALKVEDWMAVPVMSDGHRIGK
jgi:hypothetical protein